MYIYSDIVRLSSQKKIGSLLERAITSKSQEKESISGNNLSKFSKKIQLTKVEPIFEMPRKLRDWPDHKVVWL